MADCILVIDDDTLMRPNLAYRLEQTVYRTGPVSAEQALALVKVYPPEVIFLTARRTKLDQAMRLEPRTEGTVTQPFNLHVRLTRKAAAIDQHATPLTRWWQVWVPIVFAAGVLLLVMVAPQWMAWAQAIATSELPTEDMAWTWLTHLMADPVTPFNSLLTPMALTWLNSSQLMDAPMTLGTILLAAASVAGLAQLLGQQHKTTVARCHAPGRLE